MKRLLTALIDFYRKFISPLKPPCCRFIPTCSCYAKEALQKRGAFVGFFLALFRVLRCNPLFKGGYDPVPEKKFKKISFRDSDLKTGEDNG